MEFPLIAARDQTVNAAHQGCFTASTCTGNKQQLSGMEVKADIADGRLAPAAIPKFQVIH